MLTTTKKHTVLKKSLLHRDFTRVGRDFFSLRDIWNTSSKDVSHDTIRQLRNEGQRG